MAFIQCDFNSEVLGISVSLNAIIPQSSPAVKNRKYPVLYLLHGLSDDHTIWMRRTAIERHVEGMGLAVIMPSVNRSFYADMKYGYKYWTFISEELPAFVQSIFPISDKREDTFATGLSMGGYGAMKLALNYPEKFAAAASLSGALDNVYSVDNKQFPDYEIIFGENAKIKGTNCDLFYLAEKVAASKEPKPMLFQCCGTEDFLYEDNIRFRDFCRKLPLEYTYEEEPGDHNWGYWDMKIQSVLKWLPLKKG